MAELNYTTRSIRRHGAKDMWEITLSHKNPLTGEVIRTYHKVEAKTRKQAEKKRDALILELERKGGALVSGVTVREFMDRFLDYKEESGTIEPSTVRSYRTETKLICKYIGGEKLVSVTIATVNDWMAEEEKDIAAEIIEEAETEDAAAKAASESLVIVPGNEPAIRDLIYTVRGTQVMLDSDLAMLYQVETKRINEAVRRNKPVFPRNFAFA